MLRRKSPSAESVAPEPKGYVAYPALTEPFVAGHAPVGIHFYKTEEAFYLPYAALQAMRLKGESLTLIFATDEVQIEGRGLHSLYAQIAAQKVKRVHEQGERYEGDDEVAVFIRRIVCQARSDGDDAAETPNT
jgi:hypothetical protein